MNTTDMLITLITSIIENMTLLGVMFHLTHVSIANIRTSKKSLGLITLSLSIMYLIQQFNNSQIQFGITIAFIQFAVVIRLISGMPMKHVMTSILFSYLLQFLFQVPGIVVALLLNPNFNFVTSVYGLLAIICFASLFIILSLRFLPIRRLYEKALQIPSFIIFTTAFFFAFYGIACALFREIYMPDYLIFLFVVIFLLLVFFLVIFYAVQAQKKEQAVHFYETYLPILDDMILNVRKTQHNHNNTISAIASLPQIAADYDSLAASLEHYSSHMVKEMIPTRFLHFENKLLTALLYNKYCLFAEQKIKLDIVIHSYHYKSRANEFQIVDLTGILLDNAMEASHPNDTVYVEIGMPLHKNDGKETSDTPSPFSIAVKNLGPEATPDFIKKIFTPDYTSKTRQALQHGLGLPYVKSLVHQCKGQIEIENDMIASDNTKQPCRYLIIHVSV